MSSINEKLSLANKSYLLDALKSKIVENSLSGRCVDDGSTHCPEKSDFDDLNQWKESRMRKLKNVNGSRRRFMDLGNDGTVESLVDEKEVINSANKYPQLLCHFYKDEFQRCKVLDNLLKVLAKDHLDTKFVRIPVEKSPFFMQKLNIKVLPTLAGIIDGQVVRVFIGFNEFNGDSINVNSIKNTLYKHKLITNECIYAEDVESDEEDV